MVMVEFTRAGWRQFAKMNQSLGSRFIKGFSLRREVAAYIAHHNQGGVSLDCGCQELHYEKGVYLIMKCVQGVWQITDIWVENEPLGFAPVYFWTRVKRGCSRLLSRVIIGWQQLVCRHESEVLPS